MTNTITSLKPSCFLIPVITLFLFTAIFVSACGSTGDSGNTDGSGISTTQTETAAESLTDNSLNSSSTGENTVPADQSALTEREISIEIEGLSREYTFICMNDLHIIADLSDVSEDHLEEVKDRQASITAKDGTMTVDIWREMAPMLDDYHADAILFLGDMIDYYSEGNFAALKEGFDLLETPYMYLRADHDLGLWYSGYTDAEKADAAAARDAAETALCDNSGMIVMDFGEFILAGFNRSTSQLTEDGLDTLNEIKADGRPVILATHVPFQSVLDDDLDAKSRKGWGDRSLVWGYRDATYVPNEQTSQLVDFIYAEDSPVVGVLGAHMHFGFTGKVTEKAPQYVLRPSYRRLLTILHVVPG